jgi:hypothetical protein
MSLTRLPIVARTALSNPLIHPLLQGWQTFLVVNLGPCQRFGGAVTVFQYSVGDFESAPTDEMSQTGHTSSLFPAGLVQKRQTRDVTRRLFHIEAL